MELLRKATPARRVALALSLSRSVMELARSGNARRMPGADDREVGLSFVALHYGEDLARELEAYLAARGR